MKEQKRLLLLKIASLLAVLAYTIPAVLSARILIFGHDGGALGLVHPLFFYFAGVMAGFVWVNSRSAFLERITAGKFVGFIFFLLNKKPSAKFIRTATAYLGVAGPFVYALLVYKSQGFFRIAFEVLVISLLYVAGLKLSLKEVESILAKMTVITGVIASAGTIAITFLDQRCEYLKPYIIVSIYFFIAILLIVQNQDSLNRQIFGKKTVEKAAVPKNIRAYNIKITIIIFGILLVISSLKGIIELVLKAGVFISAKVTYLIMKLMSLLLPTQEEPQAEGSMEAPSDFFVGDYEINPIANFIYSVVQYFVILYIAYKFLPILFRKSGQLLKKIAHFISKLFKRTSSAPMVQVHEYEDEVETISAPPEVNRKHTKVRRLRKDKDLHRVTDPIERIRFMYGLLLDKLKIKGAKIVPSDTTSEILSKMDIVISRNKEAGRISSIYESVRYGEQIPDKTQVSEAEKCYCELVSALKNKTGQTAAPAKEH